ncbi:hypothetical protein E4T47_03458 [Aureobasidium subglaciale]|nr:hypothetical protein E4T43_05049 [Aureobasidium subglaciale]KAI5273357.1 hypothetical protein E4T47_03458 [Aureobasidium subglaciale]
MAEPRGAWSRPRGGAARTPQSRSSNASPAPPSSAAAPSKPAASPAPTPVPAGNVWAARAAAQKGPAAPTKKEKSTPAATQAKEEGSLKKVEQSGSAPIGDAVCMGNGQNFFTELAKQVAALQAKDAPQKAK